MIKRLFSILLSVCMVLTILPSVVFAEGEQAQWGIAGDDGSAPMTWEGNGDLAAAMNYANGLDEGNIAYIQLLGDINKDNHTTWPLNFNSGKTTILDLNGKNIDRGLTSSVASISGHVIAVGGDLTLKDSSSSANGKITGGNTNTTYYSCGGVYVEENGKFTMLSGNITGNKGQTGGGVFVGSNGNFEMQGGNITDNLASAGAGVYVNNIGILTMKGGNITGNTAVNGGGVYIGWSNPKFGLFNMQGGSIADNVAKNGGGVYNGGDLTITGGSITRNKSEMNIRGGDGGGIYTQGTLKVGGTAVIKENYYMSGGSSFERNLALYKSISIVEPLTSGAAIGVTALNTMNNGFLMAETNFPWSFTNENLINYSSFFFSDNRNYVILYGTDKKLTIDLWRANHTAAASANTYTPIVGEDDEITLTVKDNLGNTDTSFDGDKNVTIAGVEAAPGGIYGSFNGTALDSSSAGAGQAIGVTFADGVATPKLKLDKADKQSIGFSIAGVTTPATNTLTITPTHGTAASMAVTQDITAPISNGRQFAQQPKVTLKDAYGNICTSDITTVVTAAKEDAGTWTLTGTTTATAISGVATFTNLGATNVSQVTGAQLAFNSGSLVEATSSAVTLPAPAGAQIATSSAGSLTPTAGADDAITFTVKDALGNTDPNFDGAHNVTIAGVEAAPDGTYGDFNGTALTSDSAGTGQAISLDFANGVATPNLKLNKADAQTIEFSIEGVTTPVTNTLTITPTHGTAASMVVTQDITAPISNGGQFAQQPKVTLKDAYGNICTSDNTTIVTAVKEDAGTWTLTGTTTATAINGIATFANLGATNATLVNSAQLSFTSEALTKVTSAAVTLPAPVVTNSGGGSGTTNTTPVQSTIVIVNGVQQNAGTETISTDKGQSTVTVTVNNEKIESKINEFVKNNTDGDNNLIQIPIADTKSEVSKVELTGDIVKKLEKNSFDVSVKRDTVEYVIPAEEFTISKVAETLGVKETDLEDIKVEVKITRADETAVAKYNEVAKANGAALVISPISFEVVAKTTKADGSTGEVGINKFRNFVERVMEIPAGVDPGKITTGIVFNPDGTYSHVPTYVYQKDGKWYARINSLTNSTYTLIYNEAAFADAQGRWYEQIVSEMASRKIINGKSETSFDGKASITRAEFAAILIRALGLTDDGVSSFSDVRNRDWYYGSVGTGVEYSLVNGYMDGSFKPEAAITRLEAMIMVQRAAKIADYSGIAGNLAPFSDGRKIDAWAKSAAEFNVGSGLIVGNDGKLRPGDKISRAETATVILRLLQKAELVDVRTKI